MPVRISVIITSFNNAEWLKECVESVINQTLAVDEIIVADDASSDGSQDLIQSLATRYSQIRPILRQINVGVAANRDLAIREAKGELISTLDGDDFYYAEKIEREYSALVTCPENCVAYSSFDRVYPAHHKQQTDPVSIPDFEGYSAKALIQYMLFREGVLPRDMLLSKKLFLQVDGYRHHMGMYEDWDIKMRLARDASRWKHSGVAGMAHRHHGQGLSNSDPLTHLEWMLTAIFVNRDWLEPWFGPKVLYDAVARRVQFLLG